MTGRPPTQRLRAVVCAVFVFCAAVAGEGVADETAPGTVARDWSGWWIYPIPLTDEWATQPPPLRPEKLAERIAGQRGTAPPDPLRYCRPPQFTGYTEGFLGALEFLFTPGRVTMTSETGLIRRIHLDAVPPDAAAVPANTGLSTGRWDGDTLVVETTAVDPSARYPNTAFGNLEIGPGLRVTERIRRTSPDEIEFRILTEAPVVLTRPDERVRVYRRRAGPPFAREVTMCVDHDRAIDPASGRLRFDLTPPTDLAPSPRQSPSSPPSP